MPKDTSKPAKATPKANPIARVTTDICISIKPEHMANIVSRKKNHEFRKYLIAGTVKRMWFYVGAPDQTIKYVATVSRGKARGQVKDKEGLGNDDFNNGLKESKFAYEILHLHKLHVPLSGSSLRSNYKVTPPQRFTYLPKQLFNEVPWEQQEQLF